MNVRNLNFLNHSHPDNRRLAAFVLGIFLPVFFFSLYSLIGADTGVTRPNANGTTVSGTPTGCTPLFDCLNDVVTEPTSPSTGSDYITWVNNDAAFFQMDDSLNDVNTVSAITVWYYHVEGGTNAIQTIGLYDTNESTVFGAPTSVTNRSSGQWDPVTFSGLSLTQTQLNNLRVRIACTKLGGGTSNTCTGYAMYADVTYTKQYEANVAANGTQQNVNVGATNAYVGGSFAISGIVGSRNVTSITVAEAGTVNASTNLKNIKLFYELDTSTPYNCASETYAGTETQYGTTDADGFSAADGISTFTASPGPVITTTATLCVYVVLDVQNTATAAETVELQIIDPSTQVVVNGTSQDVQPATAVAISGTTILQAARLDQLHYHWRNDNNTEALATSATGGSEDTPWSTLGIGTPARLRLAVSNEGNATSNSTQYRIEYGQKVTTCANVASDSSWVDVGAAGGDFDMYDSTNLTEGNNTTDVAVSSGGVTNSPGHTFLSPNGGVRDTTSQTGGLTLTSSQFVELEYSIVASTTAIAGNSYCFRVTNAGTAINTYTKYPEATILADVTVSSLGSQTSTVSFPSTGTSVGAAFVFTDNIIGDTSINSITLTASGTVDYQNDIDNIQLRYDLDTSAPYDCNSETYSGSESQFGSTDTDGFNGSAKSTFTGSVIVNPLQTLCLYVVYDVTSAATNDETFEVRISNASTDVTLASGTVAPNSLVDLTGYTTFVETILRQKHFHWRNDDGSETGATSATDAEDATLENLRQTVPKRLRIGLANEGSQATAARAYRLEYALRTSTCALATGWTDVGAAAGDFDMYNSSNITDGSNTTNISTTTGGITDVGTTYLTTNGALKDTSSQTGSITLPGKNFVDLEYSILATASSTEGATYCFRVTDAGTPVANMYENYPKVSIKPKTDFFVQRGTFDMTGLTTTLTAGTAYVAPAASTTAFIRITNTLNTGAGGGATGNADDVTVYISDASNIRNSVTFTRPSTATGNTRVAWEIIEYVGAPGGDNEITVRQQQTATYVSGNTTVSTPTVSGVVDDNDVAVFITGSVNPDATTNYPLSNSTAAWNAGSDTATFTRGASGNTSGVSYAVIEFVGDNWVIQRNEYTYAAVGSTTARSITPVNSLSRAFIHTQKRMTSGLTTHGDYSHQVWLSGMGQISYSLDSTASTPGGHTSVAWIIENIQTIGNTMQVHQSNGTQSGGASPAVVNKDIGATIDDIQDASIFINNFGNEPGGGGGQNSFPEPMLSAELISTSQYQLYIADTSDSRSWRAEVVEWPTASRDIDQNYYRFYQDNDALTPTTPWPCQGSPCGENTPVDVLDSPIASGEVMRLRMTLAISSAAMEPGLDTFKLQYGELESTCTAISEANWHDVAPNSSTTALWRGANTSVADGTNLSTDPPAGGDLLITSVADVAGTFEEENDTLLTPFVVDPGEDVEFDWAIENNTADEKTSYCFRMLEANGTLFDNYFNYPIMRTAGYTPTLNQWQFFNDENNLTPTTTLAAENTAPTDIPFGEIVKLRTTVEESTGGDGTDIKFKLQYSEYSDFSTAVYDVEATSSCTASSTWCYADGAGVDNTVIDNAVLSDADSCVSGVGNGCGTYNEGVSTSTATYDQPAYSTAEYEFTISHAGARANAVYYFRLFDLTNATSVPASSSLPSLVTEGASLVFSMLGVNPGEVIDGETIDATSTPNSISFGSVPVDTEYTAAYRLTVDTNATEGYQVLMYTDQLLTNSYGTTINPVTGSNAAPTGWSTGCNSSAQSCFGYHVEDDLLAGGSPRFAANDSYAALSTSPEEVMYSSVPTEDTHDIVYKLQVRDEQPAGDYEAAISFISIPEF